MYFVASDGNFLDSGSQKLLKQNSLPNLRSLTLGKLIKYKNFFHVALPIIERQSLTIILNQISIVINNLCNIIKDLKLETISIAKMETINTVG